MSESFVTIREVVTDEFGNRFAIFRLEKSIKGVPVVTVHRHALGANETSAEATDRLNTYLALREFPSVDEKAIQQKLETR